MVTASRDNTARLWDAATGKEVIPPLKHESFVLHASFSPDGQRVVTASYDQTARLWDAATGEELKKVTIAPDAVETRTKDKNKTKKGQVVTTDSGLKYEDLKEGTGEAAKKGDTVEVHYTGWLARGKKFDSSLDRKEPFKFKLGAGMVFKGWDEGVAGMKTGGKRKLTIPPELGYGRGAGRVIPPDATLVFQVELLKIK